MIQTEEQAREKVNEIWAADTLFIVLSESQYKGGKSVPRVFQISPEHLSLSIFSQYEAAERFCRSEGFTVGGKCLIGRIDCRDRLRDLYSILNPALFLGVHATDLDCGTEDAMHIAIAGMLSWGGRQPQDLSVLMTKEAMAHAVQTGRTPLRFNEMPLYQPEQEVTN